MEAALLQAQDLACWRAERLIFAGLSFEVAPGEALLLTGANGAGKSSLLRLLAGLLPAAEGKLLWEGADCFADRPAHGARLRYLGHQDALKPSLTAAENLAFFAALQGGSVPESAEFWDYVWFGAYTPPPNNSLLQLAPVVSNVVVTEQLRRQGATYFTDLTLTFAVSGNYERAELWGAVADDLGFVEPNGMRRLGSTQGLAVSWQGGLSETWAL